MNNFDLPPMSSQFQTIHKNMFIVLKKYRFKYVSYKNSKMINNRILTIDNISDETSHKTSQAPSEMFNIEYEIRRLAMMFNTNLEYELPIHVIDYIMTKQIQSL